MTDIEKNPVIRKDSDENSKKSLSRRAALMRLGLTAATVYVAPTIMHIDRSANAFVIPSPCAGRGRRRRRCKKRRKRGKRSKRSRRR
ncbi:MAG: hypothetical protein CMM52_17695 [Rhodospirillaceae bacterium]|nr:hypothetical protein [Rhodospirillaceae bacterium]